MVVSGTAISVARCANAGLREIFIRPPGTASFLGNLAEKTGVPEAGSGANMWRICLSFAAVVALAIPLGVSPTQAAHPSRATCGERDSVLCSLYRGSPGYSGQKLARSHARRHAKQPRSAGEAPLHGGSAHPMRPVEGNATATATPTKVLAVRSFDPLASGSDSGELVGPAPVGAPDPWVKSILIALGAGGILSLFLAKAAEL